MLLAGTVHSKGKGYVMKRVLAWVIAAIMLCLPVGAALAAEGVDTPEKRRAEAVRYLAIVPMKGMIEDVVREIAKGRSSEISTAISERMLALTDYELLEKATVEGLVVHFTAEEIKALADFYESPTGRSVMAKMPVYTASVLPIIQHEIGRVVVEVFRELNLPLPGADA